MTKNKYCKGYTAGIRRAQHSFRKGGVWRRLVWALVGKFTLLPVYKVR